MAESREAVEDWVRESYPDTISHSFNVHFWPFFEGWLVYTDRRMVYCVRNTKGHPPVTTEWWFPYASEGPTFEHLEESIWRRLIADFGFKRSVLMINGKRLLFDLSNPPDALVREIKSDLERIRNGEMSLASSAPHHRPSIRNLEDSCGLFSCMDAQRRFSSFLSSEASMPPKNPEDFVVLATHWLLSLLGFQTYVLDIKGHQWKYGTVNGQKVQRGEIDILASSSFFRRHLACACTLNAPRAEKIDKTVAIARELSKMSRTRVDPILFVHQKATHVKRETEIPVLDVNDMKNLQQILIRGRTIEAMGLFGELVFGIKPETTSLDDWMSLP